MMDPSRDHIIVFAHGSTVPEANQAMERLAQELSQEARVPASAAFLESAQPDLASAVSRAAAAGARRLIVVPCFLTMGVHVRQDLPRLVERLRAAHPFVQIRLGQSLEGHPGVAQILLDRARQALVDAPRDSSAAVKG
jgi:sirohydrochlorin cobaltochelatase